MTWFRIKAGTASYNEGRRESKKGNYSSAVTWFSKAERYYSSEYGSHHPRVLASIERRAYCLVKLGNADAAVQQYEYVLTHARKAQSDASWIKQIEEYLAWARESSAAASGH